MDGNALSDDVLDRLINDEEKFLNKFGNKLQCDNKENDYHLFNRILGLTTEDTWTKCNDAKDYIRTMYEVMYPIIKVQRTYLQMQSKELVEAKALDKAKLKKQIREMNDKLELSVQENADLLKTNVVMITKLKENNLYDGEASKFDKVLTKEQTQEAIGKLQTRK